mgnify:CR=1 FL=1
MKKIWGILLLGLLLSGCAKPVGTINKGNSKLFTVEYETSTGGSILNHFMFGEKKDRLVYRANMRCKKINTNSKAVNFRLTFQGNIITGEMSMFEYDCED